MAAQNEPQPGDDRIEKLVIVLGRRITEQNKILHLIVESLQAIETSLHDIAVASNPAPNYRRSLSEYSTFDWASIGATVFKEDSDGVAAVEWRGQQFIRRSDDKEKYGYAVWFSRCVGKDADNNNKYVRLITFKDASEPEPVASKTKKAIGS